MRKLVSVLLVGVCSIITSVNAVEIEVKFSDSDDYRDIRPGNETRSNFKERVFREFTKQFENSAEKITIGHKLIVDVKDIDLAGDIDPFFSASHHELRVIKPIFYPRISLTYRLEDKAGNVIKESEETLKDISFMDKVRTLKYERGGFKYEKRLIDDWMKAEFVSN